MTPGEETPGLVCAHHHLYSALARGMPPPPRVPRDFPEILELVWWRLDRALDLEMIRWSAMLGALMGNPKLPRRRIVSNPSGHRLAGVSQRMDAQLHRRGVMCASPPAPGPLVRDVLLRDGSTLRPRR